MKPNTFKRAACLLMVLALLCALLPQSLPAAWAANNAGSCGEYLTWSFSPRTGVLSIEGTGDMWNFWGDRGDGSNNGVPWLAFRDQITGLELPEGLSSVGDNAFMDCLHLQAAVIPASVTRIGWYSFSGCTDLNELVLPEGLREIGAYAFSSCTGLSKLVLPSMLETLEERAFSSCTGLSAVTFLNPCCSIPEDCLANCGALTVFGYDSSTAQAFAEAQGFSFSSLGDFTAEGVCGDNLTWSLNSGTGVLTLVGEGDMWSFQGNKGDGFISSNTEPWNAYRSIITALELPEGLTSIGDVAFNGCWKLRSVVIPGNVTYVGDFAFGACNGLNEIVIPASVTGIGESAFNFCENLREVTVPASTERVGSWAFAFCSSLNSITFLNPNCEIADDCLDCSGSVTVRGYNGSTAEDIAQAHGLPFVSLGDFTDEGLCGDNLTWSFDSASGLLSIRGSGDMWDYGWVDPYEFVYAPWQGYKNYITGLSLPDGLTSITNTAFSGCCMLKTLEIPGSVRSIGESAFEDCTELTTLVLGEGVASLGFNAFCNCSSLQSAQFPGSLQAIGSYAFSGCSALRSVSIPEGLVSIGESAFAYCESLSSAALPKSLQEIDIAAFTGCASLRQLILRNPECTVKAFEHFSFHTEHGPGDDTEEDIDWQWECSESLGVPEQTVIYGVHDAEKEDAQMMTESYADDYESHEFCFRWLENYAKTYGYRFFATNAFSDVAEGKYYEIPVAWAYGMGITTGTGEGLFSPGQLCTRAQIVTFLYNAAGKPGYTLTENPFSDVKEGKWYYDAVMWAFENGITSGVDETNFGVSQSCTRGQAMTFLWKSLGSPEPETEDCPFTDVKPGKYYYKAVLWALENGITSGTSPTTFGTQDSCTRAQIVTFLYKAYEEIT